MSGLLLHAQTSGVRFYRDPILDTWYAVWRNWPKGNEAASWWEGVVLSSTLEVTSRTGGGQKDLLPRDIVPSTHEFVPSPQVPREVREAVFPVLVDGL